jgi:hypothetical protein
MDTPHQQHAARQVLIGLSRDRQVANWRFDPHCRHSALGQARLQDKANIGSLLHPMQLRFPPIGINIPAGRLDAGRPGCLPLTLNRRQTPAAHLDRIRLGSDRSVHLISRPGRYLPAAGNTSEITLGRKPIPTPGFLDTCEYLGTVYGERRWRDARGSHLFTRASLHGEVAAFNLRGKHAGVHDAITGDRIKAARKGRRIRV